MNNLQKRILTSLIILPISIFIIVKGGYFLLFFLFIVFLAGNYELFSVFKKKITAIFLDLILILSLFTIYYLREENDYSFMILLWIIILCVCSDIGGYIFGKTFRWKKLTKISPNKTLSGVLGSFTLSLFSLLIAEQLLTNYFLFTYSFLQLKYFFLVVILSLVAQIGDLMISFFKRLEDIKDTGKILPGHGGIFDRIDSLMFVVIMALVLDIFNVFP